MRRWIGCLLTVGLIALMTSSVLAQPLDNPKLPEFGEVTALEEVADDLEALWRESPELFWQIEQIRRGVDQWYETTPHRPMNTARPLIALGDEALLPMLWALVGQDPLELGMDLRAWRAWRVGLLEAVGRLRAAESVPTVLAILESSDPHDRVHRTAASAVGRVGDPQAIEAVIDIARRDAPKRAAIVAGLGDARRLVALEYLLEVAGDDDQVGLHPVAARAMGDWANQMAWRTPGRAPYLSEWEKGRHLVIDHLVAAYPEAHHGLQVEIQKSLQLAGAALSREQALQRAAQAADEDHAQSWQELADLMARSRLN